MTSKYKKNLLKNRMKRLVGIMLVLALVLTTITACGSSGEGAGSTTANGAGENADKTAGNTANGQNPDGTGAGQNPDGAGSGNSDGTNGTPDGAGSGNSNGTNQNGNLDGANQNQDGTANGNPDGTNQNGTTDGTKTTITATLIAGETFLNVPLAPEALVESCGYSTEATATVNNSTEAPATVNNNTEAPATVDNNTEATATVDNSTEAPATVNNITEADASFTYTYATEPDWTVEGQQVATIQISDGDGVSATFDTTVNVAADTEPPVFKEYRSHIVTIGDTVSYRSGVILTDNCTEGLELQIDSSAVNLKEAGEYPLIYSAVDLAGNVTTQEVTVTVREPETITEEMVYNLADEVIQSVINDDMNNMEALEALFVWTKKNVKYVNYFEQNDELSAAWEGLNYRKGDCYVYACVSKVLLTRAGYANELIYTTRHYWNLVDVGEGWYHYDTCPRKDKPYFFMWGDKQLMDYSKANGNSHDYDHTKWPDVHE